MTIDMSQFYQVFFEEAGENLTAMESLLLELDVEAADLETLNAIFRAAHSIKGGAGTFGFSDMAEVTHVLETLLDRLRKQELTPTVDMVDAFLQAGDVLKSQLQAHQEGEEYEDSRVAEVCALLEHLAHADEPTAAVAAPLAAAPTRWRLAFAPQQIGQGAATERQALFASLAELGQIQDQSGDTATRCIWQITTASGREAIEELLAFVCDPRQIELENVELEAASGQRPAVTAPMPSAETETAYGFFEPVPATANTAASGADPGYGFFDDAPGAEATQDHEQTGYGLFGGSPGMTQVAAVAQQAQLDNKRGYGFFKDLSGYNEVAANPSPTAASATTPAASARPAANRSTPADAANKRPATAESSIRVSVEKVDQLINLVGELVITHAMLADSAAGLDPVVHERIMGGLSNLERNSRDLQEAVMSIRMMPISFVFNRFPRVVRDTAATLGKKVTLKLIGEDTELDKGLIERMADPLNHLVRNSIDHGIERPEVRQAAGKSETGEIVLRASHRGGSVVVEVSDDGAGLNREKLLAKAAKQGIPMPDNPPDKEVWQLIFHAGFSTAERVTDISGRGVGMDVVRRNIEEMNGRVEVDSTAGRGTHITIRLPLTLAILDGLSVRMGSEMFILPLTVIQESIQPHPEQFKTVVGKGRIAQINDEYLPLVSLHDVFNSGQPEPDPIAGILVIVETNEGRAAVLVDELVAQHQVVIKSLETNYRKVEGVSGATIMGDGRVALILDVDALVRLSRR
ncbi:two-component system, chemotaxis family, sensor kinase CheA [Allochromatium warmingii]|uniref:Chemotaxis protein CheA n=1 Tax=Allochromatium warmingii TaxID=61595 RepID=A0A1H3DZD0_ALLWA|nr:chemotaxis protein CheW [Allochromatium warmingii]SDX71398.1 two-component system, chemotaxis family, sensor kinase CheA [Allochromatium warmingii]